MGAIATFEIKCEAKYPKAAHWRTLDTDALLAFYDFGAKHWVHHRTNNAEWPGESHPRALTGLAHQLGLTTLLSHAA